jgi:hypothetical protein
MTATDITLWGFFSLAVISLVGGWFLRRALVKADREEEREKARAQSPSLGTRNLNT